MIAIIDLDSTIIDTIYNSDLKENEYIKKIPTIGSFQISEHVVLRPDTTRMLSFCNDKFDETILCTFSKWNRAKTILDIFELDIFFDDVITFEKLSGDDKNDLFGNFILVDDSPWKSVFTMRKLEFLGLSIVQETISKGDTTQILGMNKTINNIVINVLPYRYFMDKGRKDGELAMATWKMRRALTLAKERKEKIFQKLVPIIKDIVGEEVYFSRDSNVFTELALDKLSLAELFMSVEETFDIEIPDDFTRNITKIDDLCVLIDSKLLLV